LTWNPAGLVGPEYPTASFTHFTSFVDTAYEQLEGFYPGWLEGNWACRLFYASTYNFAEINAKGDETGNLENYDLLLQVGYAKPLGAGVSAGAAVKLFRSVLAGFQSQGAGVDAGVRYQTPWLPLALGASVQNLGTMSAFDEEADQLPAMALAGAALTFNPGPGNRMTLASDWNQPLAGDEKSYLSLGAEFVFQGTVILRGGYRFVNEFGQLAFGAGLRFAGLGLDYTYQPYADLGDNHRITVSYFYEPPKPLATVPAATVPAESAEARPLDVTEKIESLRILPRQYEAQVLFIPPQPSSPWDGPWNLTIQDEAGQQVRTFVGVTGTPAEIAWDGTNDQGAFLYGEKTFRYTYAGQGQILTGELPRLQPVFKLQFADHAILAPEVAFRFQTRPELERWQLTLSEDQSGNSVCAQAVAGPLPEEWIWDGKDFSGQAAPSDQIYHYCLEAAYPNGFKTVILERIKPIPARRVEAPQGREGILIPGILFDVDRAELKPEMTVKLLAAAWILRRLCPADMALAEGHADETGTAEHNQQLSEARAKMTANFLAGQPGVQAGQLSTVGYGTSRPENSLDSEEGRSRNRRVEIRLFIPGAGTP
jgi:outer membrane protein OmpA-like peptidoglycan-associated protein